MDSSAENVSLLPASTLGDDESAHSFLTRRKVVAGIALLVIMCIADDKPCPAIDHMIDCISESPSNIRSHSPFTWIFDCDIYSI